MLDIKLLCGGDRTDHFYHWFLSARPEPAAQLVRHIHAATLGLHERMKSVGGGIVTFKHKGSPDWRVFLGHEKWTYNHWVILGIMSDSGGGHRRRRYRYGDQNRMWGSVRKTWASYLASLQEDVPEPSVEFGALILRRLANDPAFVHEFGEAILYSLCEEGTEPGKYLLRLLISAGPGYKPLAEYMGESELRLQQITSQQGHCPVKELIGVVNALRKCQRQRLKSVEALKE